MAKKPTTSPAQKPAAHQTAPSGEATIGSAMDYAAHEAMYHRFTDLVKWGIIGAVVLVLFLFVVIHPMLSAAT